jgi:hypothetical protein
MLYFTEHYWFEKRSKFKSQSSVATECIVSIMEVLFSSLLLGKDRTVRAEKKIKGKIWGAKGC